MRKLSVFNQVSLDGYICDAQGDMNWAHKNDPEWNSWVESNASGDSELLFGRITYQQMASWWPTPMARETMPGLAERMNSRRKLVVSRTLTRADWNNTRLINTDLGSTIRTLKAEAGPSLVVLGSANLVSQLAQLDLIDALQLVVNPIVLGAGKSLFRGVTERLYLSLSATRTFQNGNVALTYERTH
jgi:dihydrofolate reductase